MIDSQIKRRDVIAARVFLLSYIVALTPQKLVITMIAGLLMLIIGIYFLFFSSYSVIKAWQMSLNKQNTNTLCDTLACGVFFVSAAFNLCVADPICKTLTHLLMLSVCVYFLLISYFDLKTGVSKC